MNTLELNPRYIVSGFKTQSRNIAQYSSKSDCKLACLLEVISSHILKHGHTCYASTQTLIKEFNLAAPRYGLKSAGRDAIFNQLNLLESHKMIIRDKQFDKTTGQGKRFVTLNLVAIGERFTGAINWAMKKADQFFARQKHDSNGSTVDKHHETSDTNALSSRSINQNTTQRSNDLSEDRNKKRANTRLDYVSWLKRTFKGDSETIHQLSESAKKGALRASGAKLLISLNKKHGNAIPERFMKLLNWIIYRDKSVAPTQEPLMLDAVAEFDEKFENYMVATGMKPSGKSFKEEYYQDRFGRYHVRWVEVV